MNKEFCITLLRMDSKSCPINKIIRWDFPDFKIEISNWYFHDNKNIGQPDDKFHQQDNDYTNFRKSSHSTWHVA